VTDIYDFQRKLSRRLLVWGAGSTAVGAVVGLLLPRPFVRGAALHAVVWGVINVAIALWGLHLARRGSRKYPDEYRDVADGLRLRRLLVVNSFLDIGYITAGAGLIVFFHANDFLLGNGIGIVLQALFLLFFDFIHAWRLPKTTPPWYDPPV
jgi:hypothetical protein